MIRCEIFAIILTAVFLSTATAKDCSGSGKYRPPGRIPDKRPCPDGLRDDGVSCWSDAHIYGKGCCCTLFTKGCCNSCKTGYRDDGCTCRKIDVGIKVTLGERWRCAANEDLINALCIPKCEEGYKPAIPPNDATWCYPVKC